MYLGMPLQGLRLVRLVIGSELVSNMSDCPRLGHFGTIGFAGIGFFGRRTSEST